MATEDQGRRRALAWYVDRLEQQVLIGRALAAFLRVRGPEIAMTAERGLPAARRLTSARPEIWDTPGLGSRGRPPVMEGRLR